MTEMTLGLHLTSTTPHELSEFLCVSRPGISLVFCDAHVAVRSCFNTDYRRAISCKSIVLPDGLPLAVLARLKHKAPINRISGPDFLPFILSAAERWSRKVLFLGSTENTRRQLCQRVDLEFPKLKYASTSLPFYGKSIQYDSSVVRHVLESKPDMILLSLGCPKQERWAFAFREHFDVPIICVGAAFDFYSLSIRRSPPFLSHIGFEWLFRVFVEPRRLFIRYLFVVPLFLILSFLDLLGLLVLPCLTRSQ